MSAEPMLRVSEVAELMRVSDRHVYRLIELGKLAAVDVSATGRQRPKLRVPEHALTTFAQRERV